MSVINKMLQDLDNRQQSHQVEAISAPQIDYQQPSSTRALVIGLCLFSSIVGAGIVFGLQQFWLTPEKNEGALLANKISSIHRQPIDHAPSLDAKPAAEQESLQTNTLAADAKRLRNQNPKAKQFASAPDEQQAGALVAKKSIETQVKPSNQHLIPEQMQVATVAAKKTSSKAKLTQTDKVQAGSMSLSLAKKSAVVSVDTRSQDSSNGNMAVTEVKLSRADLAKKQLDLALDAEQEGLLEQALKHFKLALTYDVSLHQARKHIAAYYFGQDQLTQAMTVLREGAALYPKEYDYLLLLSKVQQTAGQTQPALASLALIPDSSELALEKWHQQSELAKKIKNYDLAEQSYRLLAAAEPQQGRWWMGLGYALDAQQKYAQASQVYQQALAQQGLSTRAQDYLNNRLMQLGAFK